MTNSSWARDAFSADQSSATSHPVAPILEMSSVKTPGSDSTAMIMVGGLQNRRWVRILFENKKICDQAQIWELTCGPRVGVRHSYEISVFRRDAKYWNGGR